MAFNEKLAERVRGQVGKRNGLSEKKMFGGLAFLLHGNMSCGIHGDEPAGKIELRERLLHFAGKLNPVGRNTTFFLPTWMPDLSQGRKRPDKRLRLDI